MKKNQKPPSDAPGSRDCKNTSYENVTGGVNTCVVLTGCPCKVTTFAFVVAGYPRPAGQLLSWGNGRICHVTDWAWTDRTEPPHTHKKPTAKRQTLDR